MVQKADRFFLDIGSHGIEHIVGAHFVFDYRISLSICLQTDSLAQLFHIINMVHPLIVNDFQQNHPFQFTNLFRFRKFRLFQLITLNGFFFQFMLNLILFLPFNSLFL